MKINNLDIDQIFSIQIPLYGTSINVSYGSRKKKIQKMFRKQPKKWRKTYLKNFKYMVNENFGERPRAGAVYSYHAGLDLHYIHCFETKEPLNLIKSMSHESLHATFRILKEAGIKYSMKSEEAYTYLQQYILREILERITSDDDDDNG